MYSISGIQMGARQMVAATARILHIVKTPIKSKMIYDLPTVNLQNTFCQLSVYVFHYLRLVCLDMSYSANYDELITLGF